MVISIGKAAGLIRLAVMPTAMEKVSVPWAIRFPNSVVLLQIRIHMVGKEVSLSDRHEGQCPFL